MPYILVHSLPPPRRNPYAPELPTFTTSSRAIAHFFHSHGWRARHVYAAYPPITSSAPPSLTSSRSSSTCSTRSNGSIGSNDYISASSLSSKLLGPELEQENEPTECCLTSTGSSLLSCGPIVELHSYLIPLNPAMFHGPPATAMQVRYLRWYAHPHIDFDASDGTVDLHLPNLEALALQKEDDDDFWRGERKSERRRRRKDEALREAESAMRPRVAEKKGTLLIRLRDVENAVDELSTRDRGLRQDPGWASSRSAQKPVVMQEEEDDGECPQLVSTDGDEEIDEELGEQWETNERALLASEGLEWAEDGKTLRKTSDV
ncbi:hypothetical protein E8E11_003374 [Didymella keratinophila]|nr:hypothetical protein E8E11_003374 [Didymella keratinophila]